MALGPYSGPILPAHKAALLRNADVVVSTLPGTPETHHYLSTTEFGQMKPGATFISLGRGSVVDEAALLVALGEGGSLGGAALDVFEVEPLPKESPLWDVPDSKLLLSAHNADFTNDYFDLGWQVWAKNYEAFVRFESFPTPVDTNAGY